jgi:hypothetical protein
MSSRLGDFSAVAVITATYSERDCSAPLLQRRWTSYPYPWNRFCALPVPKLRIHRIARPLATNITFRTQLIGGVAEFCAGCGLPLFSKPLNLVALARYKEEGIRLTPQVYISSDITSLTAMLPDGERVKVGETSANAIGIKEALKRTAPLAMDGWSIYLQDQERIEYGVFRGSGNPLSVAIDDVLLKDVDPLTVVKVFGIAEECVEVRASNGNYHHVFLDHRKDDTPPPLQYLDRLVAATTARCGTDSREALESFLKKLLFTAMRESHGCVIAVTNMRRAPAFLAHDGVILEVPIDFYRFVGQLRKGEIDSNVLSNKGALLKGMLNSDGIILFDEKARLLGYNCFVKVKHEAGVVGGARRRAFAALVAKLNKGLTAAFMQSQDGWTEFAGANNGN